MEEKKDSDMKYIEMLSQVQKIVESYLFKTEYDTESIAADIFVELYTKKMYVSNLVVKNRCIDEIRHKTLIKIESLDAKPDANEIESRGYTTVTYNPELLDLLIRNSRLTAEEKQALYVAFYKGEKNLDILLPKIIDKLRKEAENLKKEG